MRILHLFSNYKWTGPAEPAAQLVRALRADGVDADIAVGKHDGDPVIAKKCRDLGIEPILSMTLSKHGRFFANRADQRILTELLERENYDLIHCHQDNDHRIAVGAVRRLGRSIPIVRHVYQVVDIERTRRNRTLFEENARHLFSISDTAVSELISAFELDPTLVTRIEVPVDLARFNPDRELPDMRSKLGIPNDAFLVGIVARVQRHRRYDLYLDAMEQLILSDEKVHGIIVGRGTNIDELAMEPVRKKGLTRRIHFPMYTSGDEYVGILKSLDVDIYLVPGSDGSCRAVRECMAMGVPVVATRRGILPELIRDGETGVLIDESIDGLEAGIRAARNDRDLLAPEARAAAQALFDPADAAATVKDVYEQILGA